MSGKKEEMVTSKRLGNARELSTFRRVDNWC
jgi:hypothetical protein